MTRSVYDAAALLTVLAGTDPKDGATARADVQRSRDYTSFLKNEKLTGVRIGVVREQLMGYNTHSDRIAEDAIKALKELGAIIVDPVKPPAAMASELGKAEFEVMLYEYKAGLEKYFAGVNGPVKTLADLHEFNEKNRDREMPYFGQETVAMAMKKGPLTTPAYRTALATCRRIARTEGIDLMIRTHRLDALFAPTGTPAWVTDLVNGDSVSGGSSTLAAVAGYPHITVPAGMAMGLPVGVSFFGRAWSEPVLLRIAYAFEQATKARRAPKYLPSVTA
jgi:amidase